MSPGERVARPAAAGPPPRADLLAAVGAGARGPPARWCCPRLVVGVVGAFLIHQTRDGLLESRVDAVVQEAEGETETAREQLAAASPTEVDESAQQQALVEPIIARGSTRGFAVVLSPPVATAYASPTVAPSSPRASTSRACPRSSRSASTRCRRRPGPTPTSGPREEIAGLPAGPGVVVGSQVRLPADNNTYTLYYLYSLDEQQSTLALVSRAMLVAGVPLLLLVAGLTWLVTRQVVTPIRMARRVAERLAAGQLQERLRVRGEDDLARLATSFNQMASNLQKQIRQLEELSRLQRRFVSDVSHELRTPITTVRMASDVIHDARPFLDPVTGRAAELLQKELDRFETLLADLLEISRFDAGAAVLEAEDVDLVDVARRVVDMTSGLAAQRDTRVVVHDPGVPCVAEADVRRVERIVRNLVTNAIDHAESRDVEIFIGADRAVGGDRRARPRHRARTGGVGDGLQPLLARRPGARPHQRRHRARACRSRWRTPTSTAAGSRPGDVPARARSSG